MLSCIYLFQIGKFTFVTVPHVLSCVWSKKWSLFEPHSIVQQSVINYKYNASSMFWSTLINSKQEKTYYCFNYGLYQIPCISIDAFLL